MLKALARTSVSVVLFAGLVSASGAYATSGSDDGSGQVSSHVEASESPSASPRVRPSESPEVEAESHKGSDDATHQETKLKACENRVKNVNKITARIVARGTRQIAVFDTIATRVEAFYTKQGKTVAGYDALVASVNAAKLKATTDLAAVKTDATVDCNNSPKSMVQNFQSALKLEIADLKAYKTAVKNLIVAVKSVDGVKDSPSPSASPSASPLGGK